jgi:hypothetical protein
MSYYPDNDPEESVERWELDHPWLHALLWALSVLMFLTLATACVYLLVVD